MKTDEISDDNPEIKEVLKALNHAKRRDILTYLKDLGRETSFSELMDYLQIDVKTSSQFSYHLKLLLTASLIVKSSTTEKYSISPLGLKACSMLDMVDTTEHDESLGQKISSSFKNISPIDQIIISFEAIGLILFFIPITSMFEFPKYALMLLIMSLVGLILFAVITYYSYRKLRYIPSLLVLSSLVYIVFLPNNQLKCGVIYMASVLGALALYQGLINSVVGGEVFLNFIGAVIGLGISILFIIDILYFEYLKKTPSLN